MVVLFCFVVPVCVLFFVSLALSPAPGSHSSCMGQLPCSDAHMIINALTNKQ